MEINNYFETEIEALEKTNDALSKGLYEDAREHIAFVEDKLKGFRKNLEKMVKAKADFDAKLRGL